MGIKISNVMKKIFWLFIFSLFCIAGYSQTNMRTALRANVYTTSGTSPYFNLQVLVADDLSRFDATFVTSGDYIYVLDGSFCWELEIDSVIFQSGNLLQIQVYDRDSTLSIVPNGQAAIVSTYPNYNLPFYVSSLRDELQSCVIQKLVERIDQIVGSELGQNNIGQNLGTGTGVYASKQDSSLQFKSLIPGDNISISANSTEITIGANPTLSYNNDTLSISEGNNVIIPLDSIYNVLTNTIGVEATPTRIYLPSHGFVLPTKGYIPINAEFNEANGSHIDSIQINYIIDVPHPDTIEVVTGGVITLNSYHGLQIGELYFLQNDGSETTSDTANVTSSTAFVLDSLSISLREIGAILERYVPIRPIPSSIITSYGSNPLNPSDSIINNIINNLYKPLGLAQAGTIYTTPYTGASINPRYQNSDPLNNSYNPSNAWIYDGKSNSVRLKEKLFALNLESASFSSQILTPITCYTDSCAITWFNTNYSNGIKLPNGFIGYVIGSGTVNSPEYIWFFTDNHNLTFDNNIIKIKTTDLDNQILSISNDTIYISGGNNIILPTKVTSVDTGFGLVGGPITTSGTLSADTSVLASKTYVTTRGYTTGSGTTGTIPVWSSSTALGDSPLTVTSGNVTATGTGAFRLPNGTDAQRPGTPTAGMTRYSTTNGALEYYGASDWEVPVKSASATGLGTSTGVLYTNTDGRATTENAFSYNSTADRLKVGPGANANVGEGNLTIFQTSDAVPALSFRTAAAPSDGNNFGLRRIAHSMLFSFNAGGNILFSGSNISINSSTILDAGSNLATTGNTAGFNGTAIRTMGSVVTSTSTGGQTSRQIYLTPTYNLTGAADGTLIGIDYAPTNTALGLGNHYGMLIRSGSVGIGNAAPTRTLHVTGEARITDLDTDPPTRIVGADADGDLGDVSATTGGIKIPSGTTAQRNAVPVSGDLRYNTDNGALEYYGASAWEVPVKSASSTGLGTAGRVYYADANGRAAADDVLYWDATNNRLGIGMSPVGTLDFVSTSGVMMNMYKHATSATESTSRAAYRSRGTAASPTALLQNDFIDLWDSCPRGASGWAIDASLVYSFVDAAPSGNNVPTGWAWTTGSSYSYDIDMMLTSSGFLGVGPNQWGSISSPTKPASALNVAGGATVGVSYKTKAAPTNSLIVEGTIGVKTAIPNTSAGLQVNNTTGGAGIIGLQTSATIAGFPIRARKIRGTEASPSAVLNGDIIGAFGFEGYDGAGYLENCFFGGAITGTVASGSVPTSLYFISGATTSYLPDFLVHSGGNVGVGSSGTGNITSTVTAPPRQLTVYGEARITDLTTDTPTQIVGADADGDLGSITVGSGLSLSSGTLSSSVTDTHLGNTNLTLTGTRSLTLGSNTLTFSGTTGAPSGVNFSMTPSTNTIAMQSLDGSLNNSTFTVAPVSTRILVTNITGGSTTNTFEVFADSVKVSPSSINENNSLTRLLAINASTGRLQYVTKSTIGLSDPGSNGILARTSSGTTTARTITAGSGIAISNGDGVSGNPTISQTYSLTHITISGGSTFFGTTAERPDNDTPGSATTSAVGSDFSVSGSTINYTGGSGALIRVQGSISFSVADDGDYYVSMYKEGTEIGATSMRVSCVAGNYYSISLPATTTSGSTNDTFDLRIATVSGNSTTTMHRYGYIIERIY